MNTGKTGGVYDRGVRSRLSSVDAQEAFGFLLLGLIGVLGIDLVRQLVVGQLAVSRVSTLVWSGIVDSYA